MAYFTFTSTAPLVQLPITAKAKTGRTLVYHVVFLEPRLESVLPFGKGTGSASRQSSKASLEQGLAANGRWRRLWERLTPGRQRGLSFFVSSAKGAATRARRVKTVFDELARGVVERTGPRRRARAPRGRRSD